MNRLKLLLAAIVLTPLTVAATAQTPAAQTTPAPALKASETVPLGDLLDDPASKAVLDKDIPGLTTHANIERARGRTLKQIQLTSGGRITDDMLAKTDADLAALPKKATPPQ